MGASWPEAAREDMTSGATPWVLICTQPRATIRALVDAGPGGAIVPVLGALGGLAGAFMERGIPSTPRLILAPVAGLVLLYVNAALLRLTGSWLDGRATTPEVRAALAWSQVPTILAFACKLPVIAVLGPELFAEGFAADVWAIFAILVSSWVSVLTLSCVAEVHRVSLWRGLGAIVLAGVIASGAVLALLMPVLLLGFGAALLQNLAP